jgi:virulence factor Mce-like protein
MMRPRAKATVAIIATAVFSSGCATNGLASLPLPAPGLGSGGYMLTAVFSNALNLPMNAKVKLAGADVGQVESMVARNYTAVTTLRIRDGVLLPRGSTVELRTATPLGDVFVSLRPPVAADPDAPMLTNGDTIGLESTAAAATVESVLSSAAILVNGGAVRNFTNIINGFGKATGDQGQAFGDLIRKSNQLLATLDSRSDQISNALSELSRLSEQLDAKNQTITELMAAARPATDALAANTTELSNLLVQVGDTSRLLARFPSLGGTDTSGRSVIRDLNTIARAANDVAVSPDTSWLALNRMMPALIKSTAGNSISVHVSVDQLVLGSIPDIGFPGDRGLHGPNRYTWNQFIGSLKYTLWRLQERVVGRGPDSPQVPVIPDPNIPGGIEIAPPPGPSEPGPQLPGLLTPGPPP